MAYVIGSACISVKDTACVDACPTDAIHSKEGSNQYFIDPATCIDCDACVPACPVNAIFPGDSVPDEQKKFVQINADFFKGFDKAQSTSYTRTKKGEPAKEGAATPSGEKPTEGVVAATAPKVAEWKEVPGWEAAYEQGKDEMFPSIEIHKRYGRVRSVFEKDGSYTIRFFLPERVPNHKFKFKYGLPDQMCTYNLTAETDKNRVKVRGVVADPSIAKLCGYANSFPDRFYVEYPFPEVVGSASVSVRGPHIVDVLIQPPAKPEARAE